MLAYIWIFAYVYMLVFYAFDMYATMQISIKARYRINDECRESSADEGEIQYIVMEKQGN